MTSLSELISNLQTDTLDSLAAFAPETTLCVAIVALLMIRIVFGRGVSAALVAFAGAGAALSFAIRDCCAAVDRGMPELFTGMLAYDDFTVYFRILLLTFACLFILFTWRSGIPDREDGPDFYTLVLGATLGMCLMASANHLLMVFMGLEIASVPSYVLAGMLKGRRRSSEAALKFAVYGAGAAGVMLYGISLLAGVLGTAHLPSMARELATLMDAGPSAGTQMVLALGGLMVMVGLAFKLSAVPFHFWAPDVFEGAAAEIGAFLSVASKAAALALLVRVALGLGYVPPPVAQTASATEQAPVTQTASANEQAGVYYRVAEADPPAHPAELEGGRVAQNRALAPVRRFIGYLVAFLAAISATFGNLAAYGQTNIKRLLAYSTIAHAGYMMMPVAAAMILVDSSHARASSAIGAMAFYITMYMFMNLGAFMIVAFLRNRIGSEEIADYAGLIHTNPGVAICFSLILISLIGIPPLAGFAAKWTIFSAVLDADLITLLFIGGINTVISLFYYLKVIRVMVLTEPTDDGPTVCLPMASVDGLFILVATAPLLVFGIFWDDIYLWAVHSASTLFS